LLYSYIVIVKIQIKAEFLNLNNYDYCFALIKDILWCSAVLMQIQAITYNTFNRILAVYA